MGHLYADDIVGKTEMLTFCYKIECYHQEFDILALLITHPQRVFTYELIMELVWNEDVTFYSRKAVSNHMGNLRKKLKITPDGLEYIKNVVGVGYKFEVP